jgi:hypothetical protein
MDSFFYPHPFSIGTVRFGSIWFGYPRMIRHLPVGTQSIWFSCRRYRFGGQRCLLFHDLTINHTILQPIWRLCDFLFCDGLLLWCLMFLFESLFSLFALAILFFIFIFSPGQHIYLESRETYDPWWGESLAN